MSSAMRAFAAAALVALAFAAAGCGSSPTGVSAGAEPGAAAAQLVPADAFAFVTIDTDGTSTQRRRLDELTRGFALRDRVLQKVRAALATRGLEYERDVKPALGPELDLAVLGVENGKPDVIALAQPEDDRKLRALASKFDEGDEHYTVQRVGQWSIVADSAEAFAAVRAAQSGRSLADAAGYVAAQRELAGDSFAHAYVSKRGLDALPPRLRTLLGGGTAWAAAKLAAGSATLHVSAAVAGAAGPAPYGAKLLRDVPSGAILAASFKNGDELVRRLHADALLGLAPLLRGEGVLYVKPSALVPEIAVELAPRDPAAALRRARALLSGKATMLGPLPLTAELSGKKLVIADTPAAVASLRGGEKLVDDGPFKEALHEAGVPERTAGLLYADVAQLAPLLQLVQQATGDKQLDPDLADTLGRIGPLVAWGSRTGSISKLDVWARRR
jgi:hypothetical protein